MTYPSKFNEQWDHVFIQSRAADRELIPGTKYLLCECYVYYTTANLIKLCFVGTMMDRVHAHYCIYNIRKRCNMAEFGKKHIPGFKPDLGYGYFEFTQDELFKPQKKKDSST